MSGADGRIWNYICPILNVEKCPCSLCRYRKRTDIYYSTWSFENVAKNCQFQFLDPPPPKIALLLVCIGEQIGTEHEVRSVITLVSCCNDHMEVKLRCSSSNTWATRGPPLERAFNGTQFFLLCIGIC